MSHYTARNIAGWKVLINNALLDKGKHAETGAKAIKKLTGAMVRVKSWMPKDQLARLQKVTVWLEVDSTSGPHGRTPTFHYHPYAGWLKKMDFHPGKAKCVEFSNAASLARQSDNGAATILLHELAHSYHDQVLGYNNREVIAAHKRARTEGKYPARDWVVRANHTEFFAGVTTRYFGTKTEREALVRHDPILAKLLGKVWGEPKGTMDSSAPKTRPPRRGATTRPAKALRYEPMSHYSAKNIAGWKVLVNNALLDKGSRAETGARAIKKLTDAMVRLKSWMPQAQLAKLQKVTVWLEVDSTRGPHGRTSAYQYHPFGGWLKKMDFHPGKVKCVEFGNAASLAGRADDRAVTVLLHELAHAYHDQVLGFNHAEVLAAHKRARTEGKYPARDWVVRANHKEFFAGVTTRYFGTKTERQALVQRDGILAKLLGKVWGKPKGTIDSSGPEAKPGK